MLVAPLRQRKVGLWVVAGTTEGFDYVDFIYGNADLATRELAFCKLMTYLRDEVGVRRIMWHYLDSRSCTASFIVKYHLQNYRETRNVEIEIDSLAYDAYFSTLRKSIRQNIRTAYNRLRRDGHELSFNLISGDIRSNGDARKWFEDGLSLYCKRQLKYRKINWAMEQYIRRCHYMSTSVTSPEHYYCVLLIDGNVAGFMQGYLNPRRRAMEVPRLAIDDNFGWYSPGVLMVNEAIKWLIDAHYKYLDLCRGCEQYKTDMGGKLYLTQNFEVVL